jgi:hypothetical protein
MIWALILQGLVFVTWAGLMFWNLFAIRQIGRGPRYGGQPGLTATLDSFRIFLTAPEWRGRRRALGAATLAVLASSVLTYLAGA